MLCVYIALQWWMLIFDMVKASNNELVFCLSNLCEVKDAVHVAINAGFPTVGSS